MSNDGQLVDVYDGVGLDACAVEPLCWSENMSRYGLRRTEQP